VLLKLVDLLVSDWPGLDPGDRHAQAWLFFIQDLLRIFGLLAVR